MSWLSSYFVDVVKYEEYLGRDDGFNLPSYGEPVDIVCKLSRNSEVYNKDDSDFSIYNNYSIISDTPLKVGSLVNGQSINSVSEIKLFNGDIVYRATVGRYDADQY